MKYDTAKRLVLTLLVGFALLSLWNDPAGAARATTGLISDVGHFASAVIDKVVRFFRALVN
ncbi:MAG: hypothetical protein V9E89_13540 [Ilumatobacteraceae bacterium]|jgi:hypothetical protein